LPSEIGEHDIRISSRKVFFEKRVGEDEIADAKEDSTHGAQIEIIQFVEKKIQEQRHDGL
jgi:hypothetical protein